MGVSPKHLMAWCPCAGSSHIASGTLPASCNFHTSYLRHVMCWAFIAVWSLNTSWWISNKHQLWPSSCVLLHIIAGTPFRRLFYSYSEKPTVVRRWIYGKLSSRCPSVSACDNLRSDRVIVRRLFLCISTSLLAVSDSVQIALSSVMFAAVNLY